MKSNKDSSLCSVAILLSYISKGAYKANLFYNQGDDLVHGRSLLGYQLLTSSKQRTTAIGYLGLDYARVLA